MIKTIKYNTIKIHYFHYYFTMNLLNLQDNYIKYHSSITTRFSYAYKVYNYYYYYC